MLELSHTIYPIKEKIWIFCFILLPSFKREKKSLLDVREKIAKPC
jgi:hypothetical protein